MKLGSGAAKQKFYDRVAELGGQVIEPQWLGLRRPHRVTCKVGHVVTPSPISVVNGRGICRVCARKDPAAARQEFERRVAELGGRVLEPGWLGCMAPHLVECICGQLSHTRPNDVQQGHGFCRTCAGNDPRTAERAFHLRVTELGGKVVEPQWLGVHQPHRVICPAGHLTQSRPGDLRRGCGLCWECSHQTWDAFYVVTNNDLDRVKFGITSGDPQHRLSCHRRAGYDSIIRSITSMARAGQLERAVLSTLRLAGATPVQGREYYDVSALPIILDVVDHWSSAPASSR